MVNLSEQRSGSPSRAQWIAVVAVFGAVWGGAEITLGALLRAAAIPMHGVPICGIGIVIALVGRRVLASSGRSGRGTTLAIGVVAAALIPLSVTRGIPQAMVGVISEAACLEAVLWAGRPGRMRFGLAGLLTGLMPLLQMLLWLAVQVGPAAFSTFREIVLVKQGGANFGLAGQTVVVVLAVVVVLSAVIGLMCGLFAWSVAGQILKRLGRVHE